MIKINGIINDKNNLLLLLILIITFFSISCKKPVIGMYGLVEPINDYKNYTKEAIDGAFVRWLESSGAEIVIIHIWYTKEELINLLNQINGIVFSAGFRRPLKFDEPWEKKAEFIFEYAKNNSIPVWGTCLGMQMICFFISKDENIFDKYNNIGLETVELTKKVNSNMFSLFKKNDIADFETKPSTYHIHQRGVSPEKFNNNKNLIDNYDIIGYGYDKNNKKFVNMIESKKGLKHIIFGTQFHAEKNPYERRKKYNEENTIDSLRRAQLIAMKFVEEARNNGNLFKSDEERNKYTFINTYQKMKKGSYNNKINYYYFNIND